VRSPRSLPGSLPDVRIPADASDQDTTDSKSARPPAEFTVTKGATANILTVTDRQAPQNRYSTASYRIYFLPAAFSPTPTGTSSTVVQPVVMTTAGRVSGRKVASLVGNVEAPGLGTVLVFSDPVYFGQKGYYYCVGVNRAGVEAPPENMVNV